MMNINL